MAKLGTPLHHTITYSSGSQNFVCSQSLEDDDGFTVYLKSYSNMVGGFNAASISLRVDNNLIEVEFRIDKMTHQEVLAFARKLVSKLERDI